MKKTKSKLNIGLMGSSGKMGQALDDLLVKTDLSTIALKVSVGSQKSKNFEQHYMGLNQVPKATLATVDIWIDFSSPSGFVDLLDVAEKSGSKIVSGTTGISEKEFAKTKNFAKKHAFFWASNMSVGLWAFRQALKAFQHIQNFDFSLDEIHHTQKKDSPSGTAKTLHGDLQKIIGKKIETPTSRRIGGVFGVHTVFAASDSEVITFQHQALNRAVFAEGAIRAALWLANKKSGYYSMDDLFKNSKG